MFAFGNLGNTCYMNTALQCLMRLPALNALLDQWINPQQTVVQQFVKEFDDLRVMATTNDNCFIKPGKFRHAVELYARHKGIAEFTANEQYDAVEFVQFMLNAVHDAMARPVDFPPEAADDEIAKKCRDMMRAQFGKEFSGIVDLFYGVHVSTIKASHTPEAFLTLDLPIQGNSLVECLQAYTAPDSVAWLNESTNESETVAKQLSFWRLPVYLIVSLKRFDQQGRKNAAVIGIPEQFELNGAHYTLRVAALHQGGTRSGHYAACCQIADHWVVLDDDTSYPLDAAGFKQVYCAIYEKKCAPNV
jgi:ubiquitin C-terminal hydrolase